jgi:hypothetical protein
MERIIIPAVFQSYRPLSDKSWNLTFNCLEPNAQQREQFHSMRQSTVVLLMKTTDVTQDDTMLMDAVDSDLEGKSPSQRLRSVLNTIPQRKNL